MTLEPSREAGTQRNRRENRHNIWNEIPGKAEDWIQNSQGLNDFLISWRMEVGKNKFVDMMVEVEGMPDTVFFVRHKIRGSTESKERSRWAEGQERVEGSINLFTE